MKKISTWEAVGSVLCHDITQIVPGGKKGVAFKKGHVIEEEDIEFLLSLGKDHIYVWENEEGMVHENDAAERLKNLTGGPGLSFSEVKEGKIEFIASEDGLLKVDVQQLLKLNSLGEIILSTLHNNLPVKKGQKVAATRVVPLMIEEEKIKAAEELIREKVVKVIPFTPKKIGIVTTGNEIYYGRIKDAFGSTIDEKAKEYNCEVLGQTILPDDLDKITAAIKEWINKGAEIVICTGGMSVDPDDLTPTAIKNSGSAIISYGTPVLPGSMFLLAYNGDIPVMGLPGGVIHSKRTAFDLVFPRILAGEKLSLYDLAAYGHGGLCMGCEECRFPNCTFGKGM
jgi:molybdenum cofactor synthesis domain-containing protein